MWYWGFQGAARAQGNIRLFAAEPSVAGFRSLSRPPTGVRYDIRMVGCSPHTYTYYPPPDRQLATYKSASVCCPKMASLNLPTKE